MGQVALAFGANDMGSTMIEENVVAAAGVRNQCDVAEMVRLIRAAGRTPVQRDTLYREVAARTEPVGLLGERRRPRSRPAGGSAAARARLVESPPARRCSARALALQPPPLAAQDRRGDGQAHAG